MIESEAEFRKWLKKEVEESREAEAAFRDRAKSDLRSALLWGSVETLRMSVRGAEATRVLEALDDKATITSVKTFAAGQAYRGLANVSTRSTSYMADLARDAEAQFWGDVCEQLGIIGYAVAKGNH